MKLPSRFVLYAVLSLALMVSVALAAGKKNNGKIEKARNHAVRIADSRLDNTGGPDLFGYLYVDNQTGDSATYSWIELRGDGAATWLDFTDDSDDNTAPVGLVFNFPFYGGLYDTAIVSTNGNIQFTSSNEEYSNECLPTNELSNPMICVYWDDLQLDNGGYSPGGAVTVGYRRFGDHVVIEYDSVGNINNTDESYKMEVILWADGRIKLQYNQMVLGETGHDATIGIQADGDGPALQYVCNTDGHLPVNGLAIWFYQGNTGSITGAVHEVGGAPILLASVRINELNALTWTDASGNYAFPSVPTGTYTMRASRRGYEDGIATNVIVASGNNTTSIFSLRWAGVYTFASSNVPVNISDLDTAISTLTVADAQTIGDLDVMIDLLHTYDADLNISLRAPNGAIIVLSDRNGDSGEDYRQTVFDDEAGQSIIQGIPPFTGTFQPQEPLAQFDGLNAQGTWQLIVVDESGGDTGQILAWELYVTPLLDVNDAPSVKPNDYALLGNYPNPFNSQTVIRFTIPQTMPVSLTLYNVLGQEVRTLLNHSVNVGTHTALWDGRDGHGRDAATGLYLMRLSSPGFSATGKLFLLR